MSNFDFPFSIFEFPMLARSFCSAPADPSPRSGQARKIESFNFFIDLLKLRRASRMTIFRLRVALSFSPGRAEL
jgi:hypothetical protein